MAALVEDRSPLQLGAEGSYKGVHFALIGRIQIKYSQGYWNEWHLLFDDMRTGWLSEAGGEYVLTFAQYVPDRLPDFAELKVGQRFVLASQTWTVSNIENAECVAGQGELPFKVGAGYPVAAVNLRNGANSGANFATLDYSETPPLLFVGEAVEFKSLKMNNLREGMAIPTATVEAQVFRCPSCGAPLQARSKDILAVGCATCGAVIDTADPNHRVLTTALGHARREIHPAHPARQQGHAGRQAGRGHRLSRQAEQERRHRLRLARIPARRREWHLPLAHRIQRPLERRRCAVEPADDQRHRRTRQRELWRPVFPPFFNDAGRRGDPGRRRIHLAGAARRNQPRARLRGAAADAVARIDRQRAELVARHLCRPGNDRRGLQTDAAA